MSFSFFNVNMHLKPVFFKGQTEVVHLLVILSIPSVNKFNFCFPDSLCNEVET